MDAYKPIYTVENKSVRSQVAKRSAALKFEPQSRLGRVGLFSVEYTDLIIYGE
jgi:hypothetical protein